jgi:hypothetical protein
MQLKKIKKEQAVYGTINADEVVLVHIKY